MRFGKIEDFARCMLGPQVLFRQLNGVNTIRQETMLVERKKLPFSAPSLTRITQLPYEHRCGSCSSNRTDNQLDAYWHRIHKCGEIHKDSREIRLFTNGQPIDLKIDGRVGFSDSLNPIKVQQVP